VFKEWILARVALHFELSLMSAAFELTAMKLERMQTRGNAPVSIYGGKTSLQSFQK
jgi:hypothetical protein